MGDAERQAAIDNPGFLDAQLATSRELYERGDYRQAVLATDVCLQFGLPAPPWLEGEIAAAMRFYYRHGGAAKRGSKGHAAKTLSARRDALRYQYVERERAKGHSLETALHLAQLAMRGTLGRGGRKAIKESYERLDRLYRDAPRKPGRKKKLPPKAD